MMEIEAARVLFKICFAGGFFVAVLLGMLVLGACFAMRLWTLRDDLQEMEEILMKLTRELNEEDGNGRNR